MQLDITNPEDSPFEGMPQHALLWWGLNGDCPRGSGENHLPGSSGAGSRAAPVERSDVLALYYAACGFNSSRGTMIEYVS